MKKLICLALVIAVVSASLVGCGAVKNTVKDIKDGLILRLRPRVEHLLEDSIVGDVMNYLGILSESGEQPTEEQPTDEQPADEQPSEQTTAAIDTPVEQPTEDTTAAEPVPVPKELSRGIIEGDTYKSEYMGIEFIKPDTWVYATDAEMAALMNISVDMMLNDNLKSALENNPAIYDMMAADTIAGANVIVGYENLERTFSTDITAMQYIEAVKQNLSTAYGMTVSVTEQPAGVRIGEVEFTRVVFDAEVSGVPMTQAYYLRKTEEYMAIIVVTVSSGYTVSDIEAMFR